MPRVQRHIRQPDRNAVGRANRNKVRIEANRDLIRDALSQHISGGNPAIATAPKLQSSNQRLSISRDTWILDITHMDCLLSTSIRPYLLTVSSASSRMIVKAKIQETHTPSDIVATLTEWVGQLGIPEILATDNSPLFNSRELQVWASKYGVRHEASDVRSSDNLRHVEHALLGIRKDTFSPQKPTLH